MRMIILLLLSMISATAFSQSNDTLLKKYDQQLLYRYGSSFMKGGNKVSFTDLRAEFNSSSLSFDLYKKSKRIKR